MTDHEKKRIIASTGAILLTCSMGACTDTFIGDWHAQTMERAEQTYQLPLVHEENSGYWDDFENGWYGSMIRRTGLYVRLHIEPGMSGEWNKQTYSETFFEGHPDEDFIPDELTTTIQNIDGRAQAGGLRIEIEGEERLSLQCAQPNDDGMNCRQLQNGTTTAEFDFQPGDYPRRVNTTDD